MKILGIDTSCDDTCISLIKVKSQKAKLHTPPPPEGPKRKFGRAEGGSESRPRGGPLVKTFDILSNVISSQVKLHAKYGGVYPFLAKREHQKNLPLVFKKAIKEAKLALSDSRRVDLIGVTIGPGLEPCLWQGVNFAKDLAKNLALPIVPINHVEAHIYANFLNYVARERNLFPAICLIVSGGHTQLILMKNHGQYKILGETRDDAAGECFDKVARILGLGYPGGPVIAAKAAKLKTKNYKLKTKLPRPMIYQKNYDFSFAGLKTAVLYDFRSRPEKIRKSILRRSSGLTLSEIEASKKYIREMCFETQQAIIDVLIKKTIQAAKDYRAKEIILGGGVAANEELRKQLGNAIKKNLPKTYYLKPKTCLCTDNAAMVAATAYFHQKEATKNWQKIKVNANLKI